MVKDIKNEDGFDLDFDLNRLIKDICEGQDDGAIDSYIDQTFDELFGGDDVYSVLSDVVSAVETE